MFRELHTDKMLKFTLVFIALACFLTAEARHKYAAPRPLIPRDFFEKVCAQSIFTF
jgi:hypothetical protein